MELGRYRLRGSALTRWQPVTHIVRLLDMARAYRRDDSPLHGDEKLKSSILAAFDFWIKKDPRGRNWCHNQIGVPLQMLQVLFVMEPELSPEQMKAGLKSSNARRSAPPGKTWSGSRKSPRRGPA